MIKLGNKDITPQDSIKVTKGDDLVWEGVKTLEYISPEVIDIMDSYVPTSFDLTELLKNKTLISIEVDDLKIQDFTALIVHKSGFYLSMGLFDLAGEPSRYKNIRYIENAKIVVKYK